MSYSVAESSLHTFRIKSNLDFKNKNDEISSIVANDAVTQRHCKRKDPSDKLSGTYVGPSQGSSTRSQTYVIPFDGKERIIDFTLVGGGGAGGSIYTSPETIGNGSGGSGGIVCGRIKWTHGPLKITIGAGGYTLEDSLLLQEDGVDSKIVCNGGYTFVIAGGGSGGQNYPHSSYSAAPGIGGVNSYTPDVEILSEVNGTNGTQGVGLYVSLGSYGIGVQPGGSTPNVNIHGYYFGRLFPNSVASRITSHTMNAFVSNARLGGGGAGAAVHGLIGASALGGFGAPGGSHITRLDVEHHRCSEIEQPIFIVANSSLQNFRAKEEIAYNTLLDSENDTVIGYPINSGTYGSDISGTYLGPLQGEEQDYIVYNLEHPGFDVNVKFSLYGGGGAGGSVYNSPDTKDLILTGGGGSGAMLAGEFVWTSGDLHIKAGRGGYVNINPYGVNENGVASLITANANSYAKAEGGHAAQSYSQDNSFNGAGGIGGISSYSGDVTNIVIYSANGKNGRAEVEGTYSTKAYLVPPGGNLQKLNAAGVYGTLRKGDVTAPTVNHARYTNNNLGGGGGGSGINFIANANAVGGFGAPGGVHILFRRA